MFALFVQFVYYKKGLPQLSSIASHCCANEYGFSPMGSFAEFWEVSLTLILGINARPVDFLIHIGI